MTSGICFSTASSGGLSLLSAPQKKHSLADLIREIAIAQKWDFTSLSQGWVMRLAQDNQVRMIIGYTFPLNSSTSAKITGNKASASALLRIAGVPQIRHRLFSPSEPSSSDLGSLAPPTLGVWKKIRNFAEKRQYNIVCKPPEGSGGIGVHHVKTAQELDVAVTALFKRGSDVVLCPYKEIAYEYRLIMLNQEAEVIFRKVPPQIVGDGQKSIRQLVLELLAGMPSKQRETLSAHIDPKLLLSRKVVGKGDIIRVHWKHNLGQGASCELVGGKSYREMLHGISSKHPEEESDPLHLQLIRIAQEAVKALDLTFVSVDIAELRGSMSLEKRCRVMEVNAGVMMDHLMEQHGAFGVELASRVYTKALQTSFNIQIP